LCVRCSAVRDLLQLDAPSLEPYLVRASGLGAAAAAGGAPGALSAAQVAHAEALARLYISRGQYAPAAGVCELLASRAAPPEGGPGPELGARIAHLRAAVLQARSCGDAALVDRLEARARLAELQQRLAGELQALADRLQGGGAEAAPAAAAAAEEEEEAPAEEVAAAAAALRAELRPLEELYNDAARRYRLWGACLELVDLSHYADAPYVRQLWDLHLKARWQGGWAAAGGGDAERCAAGLAAAAAAAAALGERFYPNEASFPAAHVLLRLEQAAAGMWPAASGVQLPSAPAQRALVGACRGSHDVAVRAYEALLAARGGDPHGEELHAPFLRLRLLRSLRDVIEAGRDAAADRAPAAAGGYAGSGRGGRRELGVLAAACEAYAAEARRLPQGGEAEAVAAAFEALGSSLAGMMGA
jgi:nuclear pore complex protein Nup155